MIRDLTGNQLMTGVMWSCFWICVMSRAALCWRSCRRWMSLSDKPKSNELQLSSLDVTKEWSCSVALSNHVDLVTTWLTQCADLLLHTEMRVKYYTQISYMDEFRCFETPSFCFAPLFHSIAVHCFAVTLFRSLFVSHRSFIVSKPIHGKYDETAKEYQTTGCNILYGFI